MKSVGVCIVAALLATGVLGSCGDGGGIEAATEAERIEVVATFYPLAEAATRVGGDRVRVTNLTPVGVEPHDIELTPDQVDQLEDADLVLYLGQGFQAGVAEIAERRDEGSLDVLDGIKLSEGDGESDLDPHFWLDPRLMVDAVDAVTNALADASPDDVDLFGRNAAGYQDELGALDTQMAEGLSDCDRTAIVTSHAAFFYLARRYGLTQLPIAGLSPEAEPDADRLAALADEIDATGTTTVFAEELVPHEVADTLAREAGVTTAILSPIEGLSQAQLDAGKDYAAIMRDNLAALRKALACR